MFNWIKYTLGIKDRRKVGLSVPRPNLVGKEEIYQYCEVFDCPVFVMAYKDRTATYNIGLNITDYVAYNKQ